MSLDDRDIFSAICNRYPDQPLEFVMGEYEKARILNRLIEQRSSGEQQSITPPAQPVDAHAAEPEVSVADEVEAVPEKKRLTRRNLKFKPENAITDEYIICCVCGAKRKNLTVKHLAQHGLTVEEYKGLCRYPANLPLMSNNHLAHSREVVAKAQQARLSRKTDHDEDQDW